LIFEKDVENWFFKDTLDLVQYLGKSEDAYSLWATFYKCIKYFLKDASYSIL